MLLTQIEHESDRSIFACRKSGQAREFPDEVGKWRNRMCILLDKKQKEEAAKPCIGLIPFINKTFFHMLRAMLFVNYSSKSVCRLSTPQRVSPR